MLQRILSRSDIHPQPVISVRSQVESFGKANERDALAVAEWHSAASQSPPAYSISMPTDSEIRRMISRSGNFVVNFVGVFSGPAMQAIASQATPLVDSFLVGGFTREESQKVESPGISEARARLECEVTQELESGSHTVFIGRVLHATEK